MFQSEDKLTCQAPCKINLHLEIGEKRPDGYHDLQSVFAALDFADTLTFTPCGGGEGQTSLAVRAEWPFPQEALPLVSAENNLVCRAAALFREKTGFLPDLAVELVKRIPPGSGLGGGSSDAAATLLALNALAGRLAKGGTAQTVFATLLRGSVGNIHGKEPLSQGELMKAAAELGSDVPFFVNIAGPGASPACIASGRGELLQFLPPPPPLGLLLAFPPFASDTAAAYRLLDTAREGRKNKAKTAAALAGMGTGSPFWEKPEQWAFTNDFLDIFTHSFNKNDLYKTILDDLRNAGAAFTGLSGSGSACFGVFPDKIAAEKAKQELSGAFYTTIATFFLHSITNRVTM
jgi:4-diphosphocytidyl-2-C-methyl-D-erythritol kinase